MDAWAKLSPKQQFRIAIEIARGEGERLRAAYSNVVAVGAGLRSRGDNGIPTDAVCLRFLVGCKWAKGARGPRPVPKAIHVTRAVRGKSVQLAIPTDVSEFSGGAPHHAIDLTAGIIARRNGRAHEYGASCCLVRNAAVPEERYLLSCYHVFSQAMADTPGAIDCIDRGSGRVIGPMLEVADLDGPQIALDAALALVEDGAIDDFYVWGRAPVSRATDYDIMALPERSQLYVHGLRVAPAIGTRPAVKRTGPLPAVFQSVFPQRIPFDYQRTTGRIMYFADTLQYVARVRPGDSGSAVMDAAGKLYGMHFYGQGNMGYALSAPRLFDPNVFGVEIQLA